MLLLQVCFALYLCRYLAFTVLLRAPTRIYQFQTYAQPDFVPQFVPECLPLYPHDLRTIYDAFVRFALYSRSLVLVLGSLPRSKGTAYLPLIVEIRSVPLLGTQQPRSSQRKRPITHTIPYALLSGITVSHWPTTRSRYAVVVINSPVGLPTAGYQCPLWAPAGCCTYFRSCPGAPSSAVAQAGQLWMPQLLNSAILSARFLRAYLPVPWIYGFHPACLA
eukprot:GHVT01073525.1.p1 GENE.GHVT01073525.1~~GHVT01073525.1.p1  ORF type:complete len:220 (-),score=1.36 GHVT01073525.1:1798-2457(-)